jgi:hypothetical protein
MDRPEHPELTGSFARRFLPKRATMQRKSTSSKRRPQQFHATRSPLIFLYFLSQRSSDAFGRVRLALTVATPGVVERFAVDVLRMFRNTQRYQADLRP